MTDQTTIEWPREIWLAELDEHHNGQGRAVLSHFATIPRYEGCPDTDLEFQKYVDANIHDSAEKYWRERVEALTAERDVLKAKMDAAGRETVKKAAQALLDDDIALSEMARAMHDGPLCAYEHSYSAATETGAWCLDMARSGLTALTKEGN